MPDFIIDMIVGAIGGLALGMLIHLIISYKKDESYNWYINSLQEKHNKELRELKEKCEKYYF